jgi:hypothetical protein
MPCMQYLGGHIKSATHAGDLDPRQPACFPQCSYLKSSILEGWNWSQQTMADYTEK